MISISQPTVINKKWLRNYDFASLGLHTAQSLKYNLSRLQRGNGSLVMPENKWGRMTLRNGNNEEQELKNVLVSLRKRNKVVTSHFVDESGSLVELCQTGIYDVNIDIGLIGSDDDWSAYPEEDLLKLVNFLTSVEKNPIPVLSVQNDFLDLFDISDICVTEMQLRQTTYSNMQYLKLVCLADCASSAYGRTENNI